MNREWREKMTIEELYELQEDGNLGYACVYKKGDNGMHTDYMFPMTAENIANFIGKNAYTADKIIMTDICDRLICHLQILQTILCMFYIHLGLQGNLKELW